MYQSKYNKYKKKYLVLKNMIGSSNILYDYTNSEDVLKYVNSILPKEKSNDRPYLLILYGPPGSGKTFNRKLVIKELNLNNNFVYLSEDEYAYNTIQFNNLKNTTDLSNLKNLNQEELEGNEKFVKLQTEYNKIRKATSNMVFILLGLTLMYKHNAVIEMTGAGLSWYMTHVINEFYHYKYDIKLVYPYVENIDTLLKRTRERGFKEKRFLTKKYLNDTIQRSKDNFNKLMHSDEINKFNDVIVYDAENNKGNFEDRLIYRRKDGKEIINKNLSDQLISFV